MTHAHATFDQRPRFTMPRWNRSLNVLAPLAGIVLLAAIVAAPSFVSSEASPTSEGSREATSSADVLADGFDPFGLYRAAAANLEATE